MSTFEPRTSSAESNRLPTVPQPQVRRLWSPFQPQNVAQYHGHYFENIHRHPPTMSAVAAT